MTLTSATLFTSFLLLLPGLFLFFKPKQSAQKSTQFLRAPWANYTVFGAALVWYLLIISQLGLSDFGQHKHLFFVFFLALGIGAFFVIPDFLSVRGLAILGLLFSRKVLDIAYLEPQLTRLFLVVLMYVIIIASLYLGTVPYKLRDFFQWLFSKNSRVRSLASLLIAYALVLGCVAFNY